MSVKTAAAAPLRVVLCWHMHQPHYQDLIDGSYRLPWTYLHAIKDYTDMAAHLEAVPGARAVVNFAPTLLEQIADYGHQVDGFLNDSLPIRDPLLAALDMAALPTDHEHRVTLVKACLKVNQERVINRFPVFKELVEMAHWFLEYPEKHIYLSDQFLADLVVWYHIGWLAETVRRDDPRVEQLTAVARNFRLRHRHLLLEIINDQLQGLIPRYRALAEAGKVELAMSPYAHPIIPLLLDLGSARQAVADAPLPAADAYPDGEARARRHMDWGIEVFEHHFGRRPRGCWPSEGAVCDDTLALLGSMGFEWAASGESVLHNSLARAPATPDRWTDQAHCRPYRLDEDGIACFFRDDGLSDLIGFTYSDWHADDAVANLIHHLENLKASGGNRGARCVPIILDGENAWEYYPENGYYFLSALYEKLAEHPDIELTTFGGVLDAGDLKPGRLPGVVAGSWVYGSLSTWIGEPGKNRGWEMLVDAKRAYDEVEAAGTLDTAQAAAAEKQLAVCEGSDWFWWFGDYNPADAVSDFEYLYRMHLANLYHLIGVPPPDYLSHSFTQGHGTPDRGGVMRPGQQGG